MSGLAQILVHGGPHRERDLVQDIDGLVHPAPLMPRAGKDLVERLPEGKCAIADGNSRGDLQSALLDVEQFAPALRGFPHADVNADQVPPCPSGESLSPAVVSRLTAEWQSEYERWQGHDLSARRYVYVFLQARIEDHDECTLVCC